MKECQAKGVIGYVCKLSNECYVCGQIYGDLQAPTSDAEKIGGLNYLAGMIQGCAEENLRLKEIRETIARLAGVQTTP